MYANYCFLQSAKQRQASLQRIWNKIENSRHFLVEWECVLESWEESIVRARIQSEFESRAAKQDTFEDLESFNHLVCNSGLDAADAIILEQNALTISNSYSMNTEFNNRKIESKDEKIIDPNVMDKNLRIETQSFNHSSGASVNSKTEPEELKSGLSQWDSELEFDVKGENDEVESGPEIELNYLKMDWRSLRKELILCRSSMQQEWSWQEESRLKQFMREWVHRREEHAKHTLLYLFSFSRLLLDEESAFIHVAKQSNYERYQVFQLLKLRYNALFLQNHQSHLVEYGMLDNMDFRDRAYKENSLNHEHKHDKAFQIASEPLFEVLFCDAPESIESRSILQQTIQYIWTSIRSMFKHFSHIWEMNWDNVQQSHESKKGVSLFVQELQERREDLIKNYESSIQQPIFGGKSKESKSMDHSFSVLKLVSISERRLMLDGEPPLIELEKFWDECM